MEYGIYSIQDTMIGFNAPFIMKDDDVAKREYKNYLKNNPNAKDMRLFKLGTFNDESGVIKGIIPVMLEGGVDNGI